MSPIQELAEALQLLVVGCGLCAYALQPEPLTDAELDEIMEEVIQEATPKPEPELFIPDDIFREIAAFHSYLPRDQQEVLAAQPHIQELRRMERHDHGPMDLGGRTVTVVEYWLLTQDRANVHTEIDVYILPNGELEAEDGQFTHPAPMRMEDDGHYHFYDRWADDGYYH